ncbi:resolvase (plasmid) [Halobaculum sp. CBA1158]|uniref:resolvase n=1 Tax=Halobaculum sp. CBA1158 TaxID=2904243 RepID=UPI001F281289|nr:resolvase [Halobaculum sp. CBA1158]UIP01732.1 resolvase [Halobaculum sp. CBA1158]
MTRALAWIRKSKGSDDDIGLEEQRELVGELADEIADDVDQLDLGVHTGFSSMTRDDPAGLLDQNDRVTQAVDGIEAGRYDYLVAYDDRRVCRDEYFSVIQYAANAGDCEIVYVGDVEDDGLTFDLKRRIERDTKEEEIRKAKRAIERKKERGDDLGRPKFGMEYNEAGEQVPGDDFDKVESILDRRPDHTLREIADDLEMSVSTVSRVEKRADWYRERAEISEPA